MSRFIANLRIGRIRNNFRKDVFYLFAIYELRKIISSFNRIQGGGGGGGGCGNGYQKDPPTSFSPVTSRNIGISPKNFLTFSFNPFDTLV